MTTNQPVLDRRTFVARSILTVSVAAAAPHAVFGADANATRRYRAAIIGHTGRGNYGHELDLVFNERANVEVVAVADPVAAGRAKAAERSRAQRQYEDYREMLARERPNLVSIAPRWTDQHHAMTVAALRAGAHVYIEKPFTQTLAEADELLATAHQANLKIAVAHQIRLAPAILHLKKRLDDGLIGELLAIRAHGKQDARAGGEDMMVLGTHLFDLLRFLAGDPLWCMARVTQGGRDITRADAREATENIGPIAGDEIEAQFAFPNGVNATFTSRARNRESAGPWGFHLIGSKGVVRVLVEIFPRIHLLKAGAWSNEGKTDEWRPLPDDPARSTPAAERGFFHANQRVVDDWLQAIETNREPVCSGLAATKAVEMVMAVFQAGLTGQRVSFPLQQRGHPLG